MLAGLDVLTGYHSFKLAFQVGRNAAGEDEVDQAKATKEVMRWVKLNPQTITQKAAIIVEHFRDNVAGLLDGHAKAMVVTDLRKSAVRYKLAIDSYIATKGYGYGTLVAFSGTVIDPESGPGDFTEASMNGCPIATSFPRYSAHDFPAGYHYAWLTSRDGPHTRDLVTL